MMPIKVNESDVLYRGNGRDVQDLHCHRERPGLISAVWELTDDERRQIAAGGNIKVWLYGEPIQPSSVTVVPNSGTTAKSQVQHHRQIP